MLKNVSKDNSTNANEIIKITRSILLTLCFLILIIIIIKRDNIFIGKLIANNCLVLLLSHPL